MRMIRQTADNASPRLRSVTEGPASSQLPGPPKLKPHPGSIPAQTPLSPPPHPSVTSRETQTLSEIAPDSAPVPFSLNQNNAVCLPLVCEKRKLMWVHSNQIQVQLDSEAELDKAFSAFPYLSQRETAALAQRCSLHPDQVKVWFMLQRLRYGISWDREDICKVRKKHCNSGQAQEDEEQQNRVREDVGEGTREGKTKKGERAPKEKVRKNKWKEGGSCEEKVWCNEPRMTKMTGEEGGKRGQNDRKVEAVEEGKRKIRKQGKLMVADKRKRKKIEGEEDGAEETGAVGISTESKQSTEAQTALPIWRKKRKVGLSARSRNQSSQSTPLQEAPQKQVKSHKAKSGALREVRSTFQCPSNSLNALDPKASHSYSPQRSQPAPWKSFPHDKEHVQMELLWQSSEAAFSSTSTNEWCASWSQVVDPEKDFVQNQTHDALLPPHNRVPPSTEEASVKEANVIAPFSGFEGKAELEVKPEPELHQESTNYNTSTLKRRRKRRKKAVVVGNNPRATDVPPVLSVQHAKPGTLTKAQGPRQIHSQPRKKTWVQIELLRRSFLVCQFPTSLDYDWLMVQTGLSRADLVQWFGDMRYGVKNRRPQWLKPEEHCRLLERIRYQQLIKCIGSRSIRGELKEDVEDEA
ncbi:homeobox and leucine zipper encoding b [Myripristis murdjan]|uniref:Homeobox and leucine zipper protein Homez-like n=1 Tax=Myripristis murdjan TaxID=586833 RepID=A0A667YIF7_9TELE|nr:homeobox and leucine zipper protein Homez-like [Myripristis murdjan]XP_029931453.1 homeobox and leucine zipper protein Homez-like [Myripristis murdjan]XP_029931454.1 homeobox and leucine zipper protein Homez-like [Myripristis murdjan]